MIIMSIIIIIIIIIITIIDGIRYHYHRRCVVVMGWNLLVIRERHINYAIPKYSLSLSFTHTHLHTHSLSL